MVQPRGAGPSHLVENRAPAPRTDLPPTTRSTVDTLSGWVPVITAMTGLIAPALVFVLGRRTATQTERQQQVSNDRESRRDGKAEQRDDMQALVSGWASVQAGFQGLLEETRAERGELRGRVAALEISSREQDHKIASLEAGRERDQRLIDLAIRHIRALRKVIRELGQEPPRAGEDLEAEISS